MNLVNFLDVASPSILDIDEGVITIPLLLILLFISFLILIGIIVIIILLAKGKKNDDKRTS